MKPEQLMQPAALGLLAAAFIAVSCRPQPAPPAPQSGELQFSPAIFKVQDNQRINKAKGQLIYLPVYSNIPYLEARRNFDLGGLLTVHNTDLERTITVSQVLFFNNDGHLVKEFLNKQNITLGPLQAAKFFVPEDDKSGTGANFLVEWHADAVVNSPLVEVVMISMSSGRGISFSSAGKVIREDK